MAEKQPPELEIRVRGAWVPPDPDQLYPGLMRYFVNGKEVSQGEYFATLDEWRLSKSQKKAD